MDLVQQFFFPRKSVSDPETQRQSRLLLTLTAVVVALGVIGTTFYYMASLRRTGYQQGFFVILTVILFVVIVIYLLARQGQYRMGASVVSVALIVLTFYIALTDINFLAFLILAIIFGSIFLSMSGLLALLLLCVGGILLFTTIIPDFNVIDVLGGIGSFMVMNTAMLALSIRQRQLIEADRRCLLEKKNQELKDEVRAREFAEEELKKKLHDLEVLNEATVDRELRMKELKEKLREAEKD